MVLFAVNILNQQEQDDMWIKHVNTGIYRKYSWFENYGYHHCYPDCVICIIRSRLCMFITWHTLWYLGIFLWWIWYLRNMICQLWFILNRRFLYIHIQGWIIYWNWYKIKVIKTSQSNEELWLIWKFIPKWIPRKSTSLMEIDRSFVNLGYLFLT